MGGNLSILYSMLAAPECYQFEGSILFIEDLAEHLYHIDRMLFALNKAGALNKILGLIVGGMTDLEDTDTPFGIELEEIILSHFKYRSIPICFGFPFNGWPALQHWPFPVYHDFFNYNLFFR